MKAFGSKNWDWEAPWHQACGVGFIIGRRLESGEMDARLCNDSFLSIPHEQKAQEMTALVQC